MSIFRLNIAFLLLFPLSLIASELRISPEDLKKSLSKPVFIILDTRTTDKYEAGHIQGAINFPISLTYENKKTNGQLTQPKRMQDYFRERGIAINSQVVVYDDGQLVDAARLFWSLEVYGLTQVKILDHGYDDWINKDYPISLETTKIVTSDYVVSINHKRLASKFTTQLATHNPNQYIIDARGKNYYDGLQSSAKRAGHIPTAINYPASHNISSNDQFSSLKSLDELKQIYANVPTDQKIIIYCAIGRISAANYFALRELNYNVANYDASWKEWGNDFSLPIEN